MGGCLQRVLRNIQDRRYGFIPYAAICHLHRQVERSDSGNHLEGGEVRGNMRVEQNSAFGRKAKNFRPDCDFCEKRKDFVPFQIGFHSRSKKNENYLPI
jgi:hypothetical protein